MLGRQLLPIVSQAFVLASRIFVTRCNADPMRPDGQRVAKNACVCNDRTGERAHSIRVLRPFVVSSPSFLVQPPSRSMPESLSPQTILLVEDDHELARVVSEYLAENGYDVQVHGRGDTAAERILRDPPDAVVLDVNLPGLDGLSVCRQVRDRYRGAILMLTARSEEVDEVLGIEFGADDYLAKPVRPRALLARLKSHLRRSGGADTAIGPPLVIGGLVVDPSRRRAELRGIPIELTSAEFDLLKLLADHAGVPLSRSDIYQSIHGMRYDSQDRSIDLRISRLRRKIEEDPARPTRIKSVRGTGYLLSIEP